MNSPSTSDHIAMRKEADMAIGIDECVVRVEWVRKFFQCNLLHTFSSSIFLSLYERELTDRFYLFRTPRVG